jgi:transposase
MLKKFQRQLLTQNWQSIREGLEVQYCTSPEFGEEIFILCRSADRKNKERAIAERFRQRVEKGLQQLQKNCEQGRLKDVRIAERRIGRLLERNKRVAGYYQITGLKHDDHLTVAWTKNQELQSWAEQTEGCYLLRTNVKDWSADDLWSAYVQLSHAEAAFCIQKSDLKLRPVWHQKQERVHAHILVCFLAYVL